MSSNLEDEARRAVVGGQPGLVYFAWLLFVQFTVALLLQTASVPFGLAFTELFFFVAPLVLWLQAANLRPASFLRLGRPASQLLLLGAVVGFANFFVAGSLQAASKALMPELAGDFDSLKLFKDLSGLEVALLMATVGVFAPVCEEIAFRGYLQTVLGARYRGSLGIIVPALLFSALHVDPVGLASRAEMGAVFGLLTLFTGSIWPGVIAHATNNLFASGLILHALANQSPEATASAGLLEALATGLPALAATAALLAHVRSVASRRPDPSGDPATRLDPDAPYSLSFARARRTARRLLAAALLTLALFGALGWREAAVNFIDSGASSRTIEKRVDEPAKREQLHARLEQARAAARRGEMPLGRYRALRGRLAGADKEERKRALTQADIDEAFRAAGL